MTKPATLSTVLTAAKRKILFGFLSLTTTDIRICIQKTTLYQCSAWQSWVIYLTRLIATVIKLFKKYSTVVVFLIKENTNLEQINSTQVLVKIDNLKVNGDSTYLINVCSVVAQRHKNKFHSTIFYSWAFQTYLVCQLYVLCFSIRIIQSLYNDTKLMISTYS